MKRFKRFVLTLVIIIISFISANVLALDLNMVDSGWYWSNNLNGEPSSYHWSMYDFDGKVAYCIQPRTGEGRVYNATDDLSFSGLSSDVLNKITLYSYFGYDYPNHQLKEYRAATQSLIWNALGVSETYFDNKMNSNIDAFGIRNYENNIKGLINKYNTKPSYDGKTYDVYGLNYLEVVDKNNALSTYDVESVSSGLAENINNDFQSYGSRIYVRASDNKNVTVNLKLHDYANSNTLVYYNDQNDQKMLSQGHITMPKASFNVRFHPVVKVFKTDSGFRGCGTLSGAKYGLYLRDGDVLLETLTTNSIGMAKSTVELDLNTDYYVKEISPSSGHLLDNMEYDINFDGSDFESLVFSLEPIEKHTINIIKSYDKDRNDTYVGEEGINFDILYNNNVINTITTNNQGIAKIDLPIGSYIIKQKNTIKNYKYTSNIEVEIDKDSCDLIYYLNDEEIKGHIRLIKINNDNESVKIPGLKFKILDKLINEYVCENDSCIYETDENGIFETGLLHHGLYHIEEISKDIVGYLDNDLGMDVLVDEDTIDENNIVEVKFINQKKLGKLKLIKVDEDGNHIKIPNLEFKILDKSTKKYVCEREDCIYKTDEDGTFITKPLPFGSYHIEERSVIDNYLKNTKGMDFEIKSTDTLELRFVNERKKAKVKVYKVDEALAKVKMEGIKFKIKDLRTNEYINQIYETNKDGMFEASLPLGRYHLEELQQNLNGYLWNNEGLDFELDKNITINYINQSVRGNIIITKIGEEYVDNKFVTKPLEGVKIKLYALESIRDKGKVLFKKNSLIGTYETNSDGQIIIEDLPLGLYAIQEKETVLGNILDKEKYPVELNYLDEITPVVNAIINLENHIAKGNVRIKKINSIVKEPIANAKLAIYDTKDNLIYEGLTDDNGIINVLLPLGSYYVKELEAPAGFSINEDMLKFKIKEDLENIELEMEDEPMVLTEVMMPDTYTNINYIKILLGIVIVIIAIIGLVGVKKHL